MSEPNIPRPKKPDTKQPSKINAKAIPAELKKLDQWVLWRYEKRDGKRTKPPYQANGRLADVSKRATWASWDKVLLAMETDKFDGIGFVLTANDPYCAFDFDDCYDKGQINKRIEDYIYKLSSYTEITPSGKGLHVITKAELPERGRKKGNFEAYDADRYVTVTGKTYGPTIAIEKRQDEAVDIWHDIFGEKHATIEEAPKKAKSDAMFDLLWDGKWKEAGYKDKSQSEADLAMCNMLAARTKGNPTAIDELFRKSGLMRPKWDEKHGAQTYGQGNIDLAINKDKKKKLKIKTAVEMEQEYRVEERWIVEDWLPEGACVLVSGLPGSYKSWLTMAVAVAVASGKLFLGKYVVKRPGVCLIIQKEDSFPLTMDRLRILCTEPGKVEEKVTKKDVEWKFNLPIIPKRLSFETDRLFRFDDERTMAELEELLIKHRPTLVIIDPLYATAKAKDYMMEVAGLMNRLKPLRDKYGTSFIIVHHASRAGGGTGRGGAWGSVFLNAWGEATWATAEIAKNRVEVQRTYKGAKNFVRLILDFKIDEEGFRVDVSRQEGDAEGKKETKYEQIRELSRQGKSQRKILDQVGGSFRDIVNALKEPTEEKGEEDDRDD